MSTSAKAEVSSTREVSIFRGDGKSDLIDDILCSFAPDYRTREPFGDFNLEFKVPEGQSSKGSVILRITSQKKNCTKSEGRFLAPFPYWYSMDMEPKDHSFTFPTSDEPGQTIVDFAFSNFKTCLADEAVRAQLNKLRKHGLEHTGLTISPVWDIETSSCILATWNTSFIPSHYEDETEEQKTEPVQVTLRIHVNRRMWTQLESEELSFDQLAAEQQEFEKRKADR